MNYVNALLITVASEGYSIVESGFRFIANTDSDLVNPV